MSLLDTFGGLAGGLSQGLSQGRALAAQAQQLQLYQMQIDAAKRNLAAQAAMFQGIGGQQQPSFQSSPQQPAPPPQAPGPVGPGMQAPPAMPPPGGVPMPSGQPSQPPAPLPPAPGQASVPSGAPSPMATGTPPPAPVAPTGQPGAGQASQPDQFDPFSAVMRIAADIKRRNPDLDPLTLAQATSDTVDLMKGIQPDIRAQMQYLASLYRTQMQGQDTQAHVAATERGQDMTLQGKMAQINASVQNTQARIQAAQKRTLFIQNQITQRFTSGQMDKKTASAARNELGDAKSKLDIAKNNYNQVMANIRAGTDSLTDKNGQPNPKLAAAQNAVDDALKNYDAVTQKIVNQSPTGVGGNSADDLQGALSGGQWQPPAGAPSAKGVPDGSPLEQNGKTVAVARGGKWVQP